MDFKLYFDGSCKVNPGGPGGWGFLIEDQAGIVIAEESGFLPASDKITCNVAEWHGLLNGMRWFRRYDAGTIRSLKVFGDSKLVVSQASGRWKCKKPHLQAMQHEHKAIVKHLGINRKRQIVYQWIPREQNQAADDLSNRAYAFA